MPRKSAFWVAAIVILGLDLYTKSWVFERLGADLAKVENLEQFQRRYQGLHEVVFGEQPEGRCIRLVTMLNPGMMWGTFGEYSNILKVLRVLAVVVILYLLRGLEPGQIAAQAALGGILGGAIGNILDSFRYPGVRDFLEVDLNVMFFDPFPAFNVADSAICVGVAVLALGLLRTPKAPETASKPPESEVSHTSPP